MIPTETLADIHARARLTWPRNDAMRDYCVALEQDSYLKLQELDFGPLTAQRAAMIAAAHAIWPEWDSVLDSVESEIIAFQQLSSLATTEAADIPAKLLARWRTQASETHPAYYYDQLEFIRKQTAQYISVPDHLRHAPGSRRMPRIAA